MSLAFPLFGMSSSFLYCVFVGSSMKCAHCFICQKLSRNTISTLRDWIVEHVNSSQEVLEQDHSDVSNCKPY